MSVVAQIGNALARELAVPDVDTLTTIIVRVLVAALLGGIVGWERENKGRPAGLKTHILVSIGSALFVLAPLMAGIGGDEVTRVMQGIVSGIGFLGAGAILKLDKDERIEGLTTAAGVWMTAAIGMAAGMGQEMVALITTIVALLVVRAIPRMHHPARAAPTGEDISGRDA
ncbi:MgtC/SapB family protein [Luteimonas deserti]|uniref:Protein MgtC n=1 Tax=Luteimonas deserti TaxID=2752306 RepID=A0A7Z0QQC2_9GAMM|nr:MgtC/SapB family protein [Luteimonas deserti]NYZ62758.1 MgtC/SapB family protein [Luteimonas deserti]